MSWLKNVDVEIKNFVSARQIDSTTRPSKGGDFMRSFDFQKNKPKCHIFLTHGPRKSRRLLIGKYHFYIRKFFRILCCLLAIMATCSARQSRMDPATTPEGKLPPFEVTKALAFKCLNAAPNFSNSFPNLSQLFVLGVAFILSLRKRD